MIFTCGPYFPLHLSYEEGGRLLAAGCKGFNGAGSEVRLFDVRFPTATATGTAGTSSETPQGERRHFTGHRQDVTGVSFLGTFIP